jgi:hypothetical protein
LEHSLRGFFAHLYCCSDEHSRSSFSFQSRMERWVLVVYIRFPKWTLLSV